MNLKVSRRNVLKTGLVMAGAATLPSFLFGPTRFRAHAQDNTLLPGSPGVEGGWQTLLPPVPNGLPMDPPIDIRANVTVHANASFTGGDTRENSPFTRMIASLMGINWKAAWIAEGEDNQQKLQLAIAANDLPDVIDWVSPDFFKQMLEAGMLEDITDAWEAHASPQLKANLDNPLAWSYAEVDGRKYGMPAIEFLAQNDKVMWIRQDWLDKVGMSVPTTLDELSTVTQAFMEAKLGGDSPIGLNASDELNTWVSSLDPIFGAFGVMPSPFGGAVNSVWTPAEDGSLMYDSLRPQMKEALALLSDWYKRGLIRQDFFTVAPGDSVGAMVGNQSGINFSPAWHAGWGVVGSTENDPEARWTFAEVPAGPGGKRGKMWSNPYRETSYVIRKGFPHVEQVIKYWSWMTEFFQPANRMHGWEGYNYTLTDGAYAQTEIQQEWFGWNFVHNGQDPNRLATDDQLVESWKAIPEAERDAYQVWALDPARGNRDLQTAAYAHSVEVTESQGIKNLFNALPTPSMNAFGATLVGLETAAFIQIISGQQPIDYFDEFVSQWRNNGGDSITAEVNEWYSSRQ